MPYWEMFNALLVDCGASMSRGCWQLLQMDSSRDGCRLEVADLHPLLTAVHARLGEAVNWRHSPKMMMPLVAKKRK